MEKKPTVAARIRALEEALGRAQQWIAVEQERRDSYRPPAPNDVRTALGFADALRDEHAEGKLTDSERSAVVLAATLRELSRSWARYRRTGDQGALDDIGNLLERHLG